jgi:hypothetical protein
MYLVPILQVKQAGTDILKFWVFLERNGNHLIQLEGPESQWLEAAKAFSSDNGLALLGDPVQLGDYVYIHVDSATKDLNLFYTWREAPPGTPLKEVWRAFLWISDESNRDPLGVNVLLKAISLGEPTHTAYSVLNTWHTRQISATP